MPLGTTKNGCFPNEIYANVLEHVTDMETRNSCMEVSRLFRQLCQEDVLFTDSMIFQPCEACKTCLEPDDFPKSFNAYDISSGARGKVNLERVVGNSMYRENIPSWTLGVGTGYNKKSVLKGFTFKFFENSDTMEWNSEY